MGLMITMGHEEAIAIALSDFCHRHFFRVVVISIEVPFFEVQELLFTDWVVAFWCDPGGPRHLKNTASGPSLVCGSTTW